MTTPTNTQQSGTTSTLVAAKDVPSFHLMTGVPDVRGWEVTVQDNSRVGVVSRLWLGQKDHEIRYLEISMGAPSGEARTIVPAGLATVAQDRKHVVLRMPNASTITSGPHLKSDTVTPEFEASAVKAYAGSVKLADGAERYSDPVFHFGGAGSKGTH